MKLNIVPARKGVEWATLGLRTFFKQPLALAGLFFMFIAAIAVIGLVPRLGGVLAMLLFPAAGLGLMAGTRDATEGRFPMPSRLFTGYVESSDKGKGLLMLGVFYAAAVVLAISITALIDGGTFASLYLLGGSIDRDLVMKPDFQLAMWSMLLLYVPISALFWHAPALVHWQGFKPGKAMFYSWVACLRNWRALAVFGLTWAGLSLASSAVLSMIAVALGGPKVLQIVVMPLALLLGAAFFVSVYFSYRDSFDLSEPESGASP
jgi:hypothetical protein